MKIRELADFEGQLSLARVVGGVEFRAQDETGTRLVFTLTDDETRTFLVSVKRALESKEPEPPQELRKIEGKQLKERREALEISVETMARIVRTTRDEILCVESGLRSVQRGLPARMGTALGNIEKLAHSEPEPKSTYVPVAKRMHEPAAVAAREASANTKTYRMSAAEAKRRSKRKQIPPEYDIEHVIDDKDFAIERKVFEHKSLRDKIKERNGSS